MRMTCGVPSDFSEANFYGSTLGLREYGSFVPISTSTIPSLSNKDDIRIALLTNEIHCHQKRTQELLHLQSTKKQTLKGTCSFRSRLYSPTTNPPDMLSIIRSLLQPGLFLEQPHETEEQKGNSAVYPSHPSCDFARSQKTRKASVIKQPLRKRHRVDMRSEKKRERQM